MFFFFFQGLKKRGLILMAIFFHAGAWAAQPPIKLAMIEGLSGPFANTGEAVYRNLVWAMSSSVEPPSQGLGQKVERKHAQHSAHVGSRCLQQSDRKKKADVELNQH